MKNHHFSFGLESLVMLQVDLEHNKNEGLKKLSEPKTNPFSLHNLKPFQSARRREWGFNHYNYY